jgi:hypothetical protein
MSLKISGGRSAFFDLMRLICHWGTAGSVAY